MLQSDWLSYETLSVICMQWAKLLYKMGNFSFLNFSEVLVTSLETVAKFPSGLNEEHRSAITQLYRLKHNCNYILNRHLSSQENQEPVIDFIASGFCKTIKNFSYSSLHFCIRFYVSFVSKSLTLAFLISIWWVKGT